MDPDEKVLRIVAERKVNSPSKAESFTVGTSRSPMTIDDYTFVPGQEFLLGYAFNTKNNDNKIKVKHQKAGKV
jgi:hypothetical protein